MWAGGQCTVDRTSFVGCIYVQDEFSVALTRDLVTWYKVSYQSSFI